MNKRAGHGKTIACATGLVIGALGAASCRRATGYLAA